MVDPGRPLPLAAGFSTGPTLHIDLTEKAPGNDQADPLRQSAGALWYPSTHDEADPSLGLEPMLLASATISMADFKRWELFDKTPALPSHSTGVIELMPTSDGEVYGFKYVNGHPSNTAEGLQTRDRLWPAGKCRQSDIRCLLSEMTMQPHCACGDVGGGGAAAGPQGRRMSMAMMARAQVRNPDPRDEGQFVWHRRGAGL